MDYKFWLPLAVTVIGVGFQALPSKAYETKDRRDTVTALAKAGSSRKSIGQETLHASVRNGRIDSCVLVAFHNRGY